jgi:hypothetical protein
MPPPRTPLFTSDADDDDGGTAIAAVGVDGGCPAVDAADGPTGAADEADAVSICAMVCGGGPVVGLRNAAGDAAPAAAADDISEEDGVSGADAEGTT